MWMFFYGEVLITVKDGLDVDVATQTATLYLWKRSDKIVVSDIDGTITKYACPPVFLNSR